MSTALIREKALEMYARLQEEGECPINPEFQASKGWFEKFKQRFGLHNVSMQGEAASADQEAAERYRDVLAKIIREGVYLPEQIFNADETGLNWKKMPKRTFIAQSEKRPLDIKCPKKELQFFSAAMPPGHCV